MNQKWKKREHEQTEDLKRHYDNLCRTVGILKLDPYNMKKRRKYWTGKQVYSRLQTRLKREHKKKIISELYNLYTVYIDGRLNSMHMAIFNFQVNELVNLWSGWLKDESCDKQLSNNQKPDLVSYITELLGNLEQIKIEKLMKRVQHELFQSTRRSKYSYYHVKKTWLTIIII